LRRKLWRILSALIILIFAKQVVAQTPAASGPPAKDEQGSGMTLNTAFSGSVASGGDVFDWTTAAGYVFNKHFSADVGVPILFVRGTTSTGTTTSSNGLGNIFGQLQFLEKTPVLNFGSVAKAALPTGDSSKGLSTGRVTFDWTSQVAKHLGRFTPFLSAGVGNSIFDSRYWNRPYTTLGDVAHFEGGSSFALGRSLTISASAYDIAPWGSQKVYSRVVGKGSIGTGNAAGHGRVYQDNALTTGNSAIDSDNGFNVDLDFSPMKYVDFDFAYTHSVHFQLDTFSFSVGFNLTPLLRRSGISRN
jgi:hypothetical protein